MASNKKILINRLLEKSGDAFTFAISVMNNPTMKYRSENFCFNIINAWELSLKAKIIRDFGEDKIYLDKKKERTINIKKCIEMVFTDFQNPTKRNIEIIERIRNRETHFITPEYDDLFVSVYQANIVYYSEFMKKEFDININDRFPSNFLTIASNPKSLDDVRFIERVDPSTFNMFMKEKAYMKKMSSIDGLAVTFEVRMKNVKKNADLTYRIDPNAEMTAQVIEKIQDPNNTHPYRQKDVIRIVNAKVGYEALNQYSFKCIKIYEKITDDTIEYVYYHKQSNSKCYSQKFVNLILKNISEMPNYITIVTETYKANKK